MGEMSLSDAEYKIIGDTNNGNFGSSLAGAGDVNNDGVADIIIGAPGVNNQTGRVYIFFGVSN